MNKKTITVGIIILCLGFFGYLAITNKKKSITPTIPSDTANKNTTSSGYVAPIVPVAPVAPELPQPSIQPITFPSNPSVETFPAVAAPPVTFPTPPQQTTVTYTAPSGSSITINYTDWDGNRQQLFILNGSQTIDCLQGSDSIISTTPYDFSNSPATLYPVPVMGATINSTYNLPSSLSQVCPIGQPMTQDCMNAILQLNQYHSDLISQREIKKAQDNGSSLNSITTQVNGGASLSVITDPNKAAILNQMYNNPNPNLTSDNTTKGVTTQNCHEDPNTGLWVCS